LALNKETKITLTILTAIVVAFIGYRFLQDLPILQKTQKIYTHYDQVNGLKEGSYVYINGVKVGSVREFKLVDDKDKVRVTLGFNTGITIRKGAVAVLKSDGLLGGMAIYVRDGKGSEPVPAGGNIPGVLEPGIVQTFTQNADSIANDASETFDRINAITAQLQKIVDKENQQKISSLLTHLKDASNEMALLMQRKRHELANSIEHANHLLANLDTLSAQNSESIDSTITNLQQASANLEQISGGTVITVEQLNSILKKIDEGKGSFGLLINDPSLYNHIDSLAANMQQLIEDINEDPDKYLKNLNLIKVF